MMYVGMKELSLYYRYIYIYKMFIPNECSKHECFIQMYLLIIAGEQKFTQCL